MQTTTLLLTTKQINELKQMLTAFDMRFDVPYSLYQAKLPDGAITAYTSLKVVFSGKSAQHYASLFQKPLAQEGMAGSDEVGTGDYFGPVTVVACYIKESDYQWLSELKIMDSKAMTDATILKVAPTLMEKLTYSLLILDNPTYNIVHQKKNLNAIKAMMHHKAYHHLKNKLGFLPKLCVVDQFMDPKRYYQVIEDDYGITHLHFETKAENKYLAVACASVIARYNFLLAMSQLSLKYNFKFPLGAGAHVDKLGRELLRQHPNLDLRQVAKVHFKNTLRIKEDASQR